MKKQRAVFTVVKNESVMLPLWLKYYSNFFEQDDIYILDHQSDDGSTDNLLCKKRLIKNDVAFDHSWLNRVVRNFQVELFHKYKYVLFAEADEFVLHLDGLGNYMDKVSEPSVQCNGYELQHVTNEEPALDFARPILEQRSYWFPHSIYSKTLIAREPVDWNLGFHKCSNFSKLEPNLYLVHLHRCDFQMALRRNELRAQMNWSTLDVEQGLGSQNRIVGGEFIQWFEGYRAWAEIQPIPVEVKNTRAF